MVDSAARALALKCISVDINSGHSFATTTARDDFFIANPTQLKESIYIYCDGKLQQYTSGAWIDKSPMIQGQKGSDGVVGKDGTTPHIDVTTKHWFIGDTDTNILAEGYDGTNGVGIKSITDNDDNTFTITLTDNTNYIIDKVISNISDVNATDLTDGGDTTLHYHSADRNRENHTGTQAISTITGLQTALDNKVDKVIGKSLLSDTEITIQI